MKMGWAIAVVVLAGVLRAQAPCHAENDGANFNDGVSIGGSLQLAIRFVAPTSFTATRLEVYTGEASGAQGLALWSHNAAANRPAALLGTGGMTIASAKQWYPAQLGSSVALVGGQTYWFVWSTGPGGQASVDSLNAGLGQPYCASTNGGSTWGSVFQFADRHWKFRIGGNCTPNPVVFCTAGTSTFGCVAQISASANPSVSGASGCVVSVANVEGQRSGILFYSLAPLPQPWCSGGSSFLCVKAPTARTVAQGSGGTLTVCNGALSLDWQAFQVANPGQLGSPWSVGAKAFVQGWLRDPPACKTTTLTNAVELTYGP